MNKFVKSVIVSSVILGIAGCSSTTKIERVSSNDSEVPNWYLDPGGDSKDIIFASATAVSDNLEFSVAKATHQARVIIAEKLAATASQNLKQFNSDHTKGGTSRLTQLTEQISRTKYDNINVSGYRILEKVIYKEDDMYRTFIHMSLAREDMTRSIPVEMTDAELKEAKSVLDSIR